ncbi:StsA family sactipeptide RiPP [Kitasatospora sp. NBC_01300]|nr:hypothetical protein OG556_35610 [Kitasatospora sp. NBC_01300]
MTESAWVKPEMRSDEFEAGMSCSCSCGAFSGAGSGHGIEDPAGE